MPHHLLQFVVQEKGHYDSVSDESPVTKGIHGAVHFESVTNSIRPRLVQKCLRDEFPEDRRARKLCGGLQCKFFDEALGKRVVSLTASPPLSAQGRVRWPPRLNDPFGRR